MNEKISKKQSLLCNRWFNYEAIQITYFITFFHKKREIIQKKVPKFQKKEGYNL